MILTLATFCKVIRLFQPSRPPVAPFSRPQDVQAASYSFPSCVSCYQQCQNSWKKQTQILYHSIVICFRVKTLTQIILKIAKCKYCIYKIYLLNTVFPRSRPCFTQGTRPFSAHDSLLFVCPFCNEGAKFGGGASLTTFVRE